MSIRGRVQAERLVKTDSETRFVNTSRDGRKSDEAHPATSSPHEERPLLCADEVIRILIAVGAIADRKQVDSLIEGETSDGIDLLRKLHEQGSVSAEIIERLNAIADAITPGGRNASTKEYSVHIKKDPSRAISRSPNADSEPLIYESSLQATTGLSTAFESVGDRQTRSSASPIEQGGELNLTSREESYELLSEIARGGMGVVYRARQRSLNRICALKMIRSGALANQTQIDRFYREAKSTARIDHPGIVPVYDIGMIDGEHFYSMAFVEGSSLFERVQREGPIEPTVAAELIATVARALQVAHDHGVIHRDLKPQNILIDSEGNPKITDFGLAKVQESSDELTIAGQVLGTPAYMPPEQAIGQEDQVGAAADIYALGATLYFVLVGRPPFQAASVADTLRQVVEHQPVPIRRLNPSVPRDLETICAYCLRKQPTSRYRTASDLADDLDRWRARRPITARRVGIVEKSWKFSRRYPISSTLVTSILFIVGLTMAIGWERRTAAVAQGLVQSLAVAEPGHVDRLLDELDGYEYWSHPTLYALLESGPSTPESDRARLHARLALVDFDTTIGPNLVDDLMSAEVGEVGNIRQALARCDMTLTTQLWQIFQDVDAPAAIRFRAGLALIHCDPNSSMWQNGDSQFLVDQLVNSNPVEQPELWSLLADIAGRLEEELLIVFRDRADRSETELVAAANAVANYFADDPAIVSTLLLEATPSQFKLLFPLIDRQPDPNTIKMLNETLTAIPQKQLDVDARIELAGKAAVAGIMLLRLNESDPVIQSLCDHGAHEFRTQFIHRCLERELPAGRIIGCLAELERLRASNSTDGNTGYAMAHRSLLLALGEYEFASIPTAQRRPFVDRLVECYARNPSSSVHGAAGWLLRRWGFEHEVTSIDRTALPYDPTGVREWFVVGIDSDGPSQFEDAIEDDSTIFITFIVHDAGDFLMGSPDTEAGHVIDETIHRVGLTRRFAISDRELTWGQYLPPGVHIRRDTYSRQFSKSISRNEPAFGINWFEAVSFCQWLTFQAGMEPDDQCYPNPRSLALRADGYPRDWPIDLDRAGFRLPTESEWEFACGTGISAMYSFGDDGSYLTEYAWTRSNSNAWSHPSAHLRPNPRGLFDVHGNLDEWCHDYWHRDNIAGESRIDPMGPGSGDDRTCRGGNWDSGETSARTAARSLGHPGSRVNTIGVRLAMTLSPLP